MADPSSPPWKLYHNPHFRSDPCHDSPHPTSDLALARAEIVSLLTELEIERRSHREANSLCKSITLELAEERRLRAEAEAEAAYFRDAADIALRETEEERRMLKFADSWREERVQMKLADAAILLEEKMREIAEIGAPRSGEIDCISMGRGRLGRENPHIKRGVKGFVESPRAACRVRSQGLGRDGDKDRVGGNLECQKAQLRALLRQRNGVDLAVVADAPNLVA
ncbi:hypothetical protein KSP39_PZI002342 [Platanthera zijinensis]|uniref:Uncharacterized protein n=1 Tax=Platanthera zijinensis TaxID=2320716 RepID=A0AAP0BYB0_9ASPA